MSFAEYTAHGWVLCPIARGTKGPTRQGWNLRERGIRDGSILDQNAGLCHAWSGTCAIDIDNLDVASQWLAERNIALSRLLSDPAAVLIASGREGRAKLLYSLTSPLTSVKTAPFTALSPKSGKVETYTALDFRCATKNGLTLQDVLPPSIHPDTGRPYEWKYNDELCASWRNPPPIPPELLAIWQSLLTAQVDAGPQAPKGVGLDQMRADLEDEDPSADYNAWIDIGARIHHETRGSREGLLLWNEWSAKADRSTGKYKGLADLEPHWRSFNWDAENALTWGGLLARKRAKADEFPIVPTGTTATEAPAPGEGIVQDTRPETVMRNLLASRAVFITQQEKWFFKPPEDGVPAIPELDMHANVGLTDRGLRMLFSAHMPYVSRTNKKGESTTEKPDPVNILRDAKSKLIVNSIGFHPGKPRVYMDEGIKYLNAYHERKRIELLRPKPQERELLDYLWSLINEEVMRAWLVKFYAHMIQKPGEKIRSAPLLYSATKGTGKGTLMKGLPVALFGGDWVSPMTESVLSSRFNSILADAWVVHLEEMHAGNNKAERRAIADKVKAWVTEATVPVERKGLDAYKMPNRFQLTAASNHEEALQIDNNERRWAISGVREQRMSEADTNEVWSFLLGERGPGVLRYVFTNEVSLTGFNPHAAAPETMAKRVVVRASLGSWESVLIEAMSKEQGPFVRDMVTLQDVMDFLAGRGPPTVHTLSTVLKRDPFNCKKMSKGSSGTRLWAWRNGDKWAYASETLRTLHMDTGARPSDYSPDVPRHILELSADGLDDEPTDGQTQDLLGELAHG